jgi:alpha-glucosidase
LLGCVEAPLIVGGFTVTRTGDGLDVTLGDRLLLTDLRADVGDGDEALQMATGSYAVASGSTTWRNYVLGATAAGETASSATSRSLPLGDNATLLLIADAPDTLRVCVEGNGNRVRFDAACTGNDHFVGLGEHAFDVDHASEAFPLWVSEPGVGKSESDDLPDDWFLTGTRHASSYPSPFMVRPEPISIEADTESRVEVDLCTGDRWGMATWAASSSFVIRAGDTPMELVQHHALASGDLEIPPAWALAPWNDAVGGEARVREVATALRAAGAPSSVIWTEDWKGAEENAFGYHLEGEWEIDRELYPGAEALASELEDQGFAWLAYFSPFLVEDTRAFDEAAEFAVRGGDGDPSMFPSASFAMASVLDLSRDDARAWAQDKMQAALDAGFDGWMADYAEWLPPDAQLAHADAIDDHNAYPRWWQETNEGVLSAHDGVDGALAFARSGWSGAASRIGVHWPGDQRTSFDADDGLPSVVPLMLGDAIEGLPLVGSDIAGYQSVGNDPSTKELWFRWCTLGAMSPVMRTHHGAYAAENWQFDTDAETLQHYARWARIHAELYPYLAGLVAEASARGTPLVRPTFFHHPGESWSRTDAYFLGPSLLVAPVVEAGATGRDIDLPTGPAWYDYWTGARAESGRFDVAVGEIAVFAPAGAIVPRFAVAPDTMLASGGAGLVTAAEADGARVVRVFAGAAGSFTEADGTTYRTDGAAASSGTGTGTFSSGTIEVAGMVVEIEGSVAREYRVEVVAP